MKKRFDLKPGVSLDNFYYLHPSLFIAIGYTLTFCKIYRVPCVFSSLTEDAPNRKSKTHADGRAFDLSVRGWNEAIIDEYIIYMEEKCGFFGAISSSDGEQRIVVYHDAGTGSHLHTQVLPNLI